MPYITEEQLMPEIRRVAGEIEAELGERDPLFVCILNGAFMFASDLAQMLDKPYDITFAKYSSYSGLTSTGELKEVMKPQVSVEGRTVVVLEDLIDSGFTLTGIEKLYLERGAKEVKVAVMLSKPLAIEKYARKPDYVGLEIPNDFIVGRGLDYDGSGRMLRDVYVLKKREEGGE